MLGIEAQDNTRTDQQLLDRAHPANDVRLSGSSYRVGLFGRDEWSIGKTLTSTLGLRMDCNDGMGIEYIRLVQPAVHDSETQGVF